MKIRHLFIGTVIGIVLGCAVGVTAMSSWGTKTLNVAGTINLTAPILKSPEPSWGYELSSATVSFGSKSITIGEQFEIDSASISITNLSNQKIPAGWYVNTSGLPMWMSATVIGGENPLDVGTTSSFAIRLTSTNTPIDIQTIDLSSATFIFKVD